MESFFLHTPEGNLYFAFHEPAGMAPEETGIILCAPVGQEYIRTHRAVLLLARKLAAHSFPTVRFDFSGCGDSAGALEEAGMATWLANIGRVVEEFEETFALKKLVLVGLRFGGSLAHAYLRTRPPDHRPDLVLWCPVYRGKQYLEELRTGHERWLAGSFAARKKNAAHEFLGFRYGPHLLREIEALNLYDDPAVKAQLVMDAAASALGVSHLLATEGSFWLKEEDDGSKSLVPYADVEALVTWMKRHYGREN